MSSAARAHSLAMSDAGDLAELIAYLSRSTRLTPAEAQRLVGEVLSFLDETPEQFVRRRHLALRAQGHANAQIYAQLLTELSAWRFCAPAYSERQIRRMIYGG